MDTKLFPSSQLNLLATGDSVECAHSRVICSGGNGRSCSRPADRSVTGHGLAKCSLGLRFCENVVWLRKGHSYGQGCLHSLHGGGPSLLSTHR
jgi:hypothetical protein